MSNNQGSSSSAPVLTNKYRPLDIQGPSYHPFTDFGILDNARVLVMNVPSIFLHTRAVSINQFRTDKILPRARKQALHCLTYICSYFTDDEGWASNFIPIIEEIPARSRAPSRQETKSMDVDEAKEEEEEEDVDNRRRRRRRHRHQNEHRAQEATEAGGLEEDGTRIVAHRIWFFIVNEPDWHPGDEFEGLIRTNCRRDQEHQRAYYRTPRRVDEKAKHFMWHELMSRDDYLTMCSRMVPGMNYNNKDDCRQMALRATANIANPFAVFDIWNAMRFLPNADPRFTNWQNYFHHENFRCTKFHFPDPSRCYRLTPTQALPHKFFYYYLPSIRTPSTKEDPDSDWYFRQLTAHVNLTDTSLIQRLMSDEQELRESRRNVDLEEQGNPEVFHPVQSTEPDLDGKYAEDDIHIPSQYLPDDPSAFQYLVEQQADADVQITVEKLEAKNRSRRREMLSNRRKREANVDPEDPNPMSQESVDARRMAAFLAYCEDRKQFEETAMSEFRAIWNEQAPVSRELLWVIQWGENFLQTRSNFCGFYPKMWHNIPMTAEWAIRVLDMAEHAFEMHTAHDIFLVLMISGLDMYYPTRNDKLHYCAFGPPGTSKSYLLDLERNILIQGPVVSVTFRSPKADTGVTNMDHSVIQYHELPPSLLGAKKPGGMSGANDDSTYLKDRMTKGEIFAQVTHIDKDTGERRRQDLHVWANTVFQGNTNIPEREVEEAMLDRFYIARFYEINREDKSLLDCIGVQWSEVAEDMKLHITTDFRRIQYLVANICKLIEIRVLPKVDLNLAHTVIKKVLARAAFLGLPKSKSPRTYNRIMRIATMLSIVSAIRYVFDMEDSPLRNKPWQDKHILLVAPYLRVSLQEVVLALGLVKNNELENRLHTQVVRAIIKKWFTPESERSRPLSTKAPEEDGKEAKEEDINLQQPLGTSSTLSSDQKKEQERRALLDKLEPFFWHEETGRSLFMDPEQSVTVHKDWLSARDAFATTRGDQKKRKRKRETKDGSARASKRPRAEGEDEKALNEAKRAARALRTPGVESTTFALEEESEEGLGDTQDDALTEVPAEELQAAQEDASMEEEDQPSSSSSNKNWNNNNRKNGKFMTETDRLWRLARMIRHEMSPKPSEGDIYSVLVDMKSRCIKALDGTRDIPVIELTDEGFMLATNAYLNLSEDIIGRALKDVLEYKYIREQDLAFEVVKGKEPYLFQCIHIEPKENQELNIVNPLFADSRQRYKMQRYMLGTDGKPIVNVDQIYSPAAEVRLDEDLDERSFYDHLTRIGWTMKQLRAAGLDTPWALEERARKLAVKKHVEELAEQKHCHPSSLSDEEKRLPMYPEGAYVSKLSKDFKEEQSTVSATGEANSTLHTSLIKRMLGVESQQANMVVE